MGRKTKLTHAVIKIVTTAIERGNTDTDAFILSGVSPSACWRWLSTGRKEYEAHANDPIHTASMEMTFFTKVEAARARFADRMLEAVEKGALLGATKRVVTTKALNDTTVETTIKEEHLPPNTGDAKWLLERRRAKDFERRMAIDHSGKIDGPPAIAAGAGTVIQLVKADGETEDITQPGTDQEKDRT